MNDKKTITVEIPVLDNVDQMKVVETFTEEQLWYVCAIAKAFEKKQSNWNSLKELIEQRIYLIEPKGTCINFYCEYDSEDDYVQGMKEQARLNVLKFVIDKMNKLESGDNK